MRAKGCGVGWGRGDGTEQSACRVCCCAQGEFGRPATPAQRLTTPVFRGEGCFSHIATQTFGMKGKRCASFQIRQAVLRRVTRLRPWRSIFDGPKRAGREAPEWPCGPEIGRVGLNVKDRHTICFSLDNAASLPHP